MAKPFRKWTVLPHGKLTRLDDNLLTVTGVLRMPPMGDVERRMTVVRLTDGRLVVYSAIALDDAEMSALESFGKPAYLIRNWNKPPPADAGGRGGCRSRARLFDIE